MSEPLAFSDLRVGMEVGPGRFEVTAAVVDELRQTIQSPSDHDRAPSALAGLYLRPAMLQLPPPPGGIYVGQRLRFHLPIHLGDRLMTNGRIEELFIRRTNRFVVMRTETLNQDNDIVTTGWSTRIWSR